MEIGAIYYPWMEIGAIYYPCPYCPDDYADAVSIEFHIREAHPAEAEEDFDSETCPVCSERVGNDMADHLILDHSDSLSVEQLLKLKAGFFGNGSSRTNLVDSVLGNASSNGVVDEELSGLNRADERAVVSEERVAEGMEARSRCDFAQDLIFSAIFDDVGL